jgi:hypothetical protein
MQRHLLAATRYYVALSCFAAAAERQRSLSEASRLLQRWRQHVRSSELTLVHRMHDFI